MRALLADIGGTNARFALLDGAAPGVPVVLEVAAFATAGDAVDEALRRLAPDGPVQVAVLALAGPVGGEVVRLTNAHWEFSAAALATRFGFASVRLVNDFMALAHALPHFVPAELRAIGAGRVAAGAPMLVLGPGTGLGMAGFLPGAGFAVPTEGGHAGLAPTDAREDVVIAGLRARCGRAGAEEALSGRGLAMLHAILAEHRAADVPARDAAAVVGACETCAVAADAVEVFLGLLAGFAGDMALAWGARGGVFLAGGILPRLARQIDAAAFRTRFEAKAPMQGWMADVPLSLVLHPAPAFPGLAALARLAKP